MVKFFYGLLSLPRLIFNFVFRTQRRWLTVQGLVLSGVARVRVWLLPGPRLYRYLGVKGEETSREQLAARQDYDARWVEYKVARVAGRTPWESRCLVQAMVAQRLLCGYGLASTVYLGVGRDEAGEMVAHAWVRCGDRYICGGDGAGYASVACFAVYPDMRRGKKGSYAGV